MKTPKVELDNPFVITIVILTALQLGLNAVWLHTWWSMVVFMLITMTPTMKPDRLLSLMWAAEVVTAALVAFRVIRGHLAVVVFITWSAVIVVVCGMRALRRSDNSIMM